MSPDIEQPQPLNHRETQTPNCEWYPNTGTGHLNEGILQARKLAGFFPIGIRDDKVLLPKNATCMLKNDFFGCDRIMPDVWTCGKMFITRRTLSSPSNLQLLNNPYSDLRMVMEPKRNAEEAIGKPPIILWQYDGMHNELHCDSGSTIRTLLHGKINPKNWQVASPFPWWCFGFLLFFRVVSGDYDKPCDWCICTSSLIGTALTGGGNGWSASQSQVKDTRNNHMWAFFLWFRFGLWLVLWCIFDICVICDMSDFHLSWQKSCGSRLSFLNVDRACRLLFFVGLCWIWWFPGFFSVYQKYSGERPQDWPQGFKCLKPHGSFSPKFLC